MRALMRPYSAGVLIGPAPGQILVGHASGTRFWDIPKGMHEADESALETALRELEEETGLVVPAAALIDMGRHAYTRQKDLWLFRVAPAPLPVPLSALVCRVTFVDRRGLARPEFDAYRIIARADLERFCAPSMARLLQRLAW